MLRAKRLQYARSRSWSSLPLSGRSHARHSRSADALATETTEANDIIGILRAQALQYTRSRRWSCPLLSGRSRARHNHSADVFVAVMTETNSIVDML